MKKLGILLAVILVGTASFAATAGQTGFGVQGLTLTTNSITMPTVQYYFNEKACGELGLAFGSVSAAGASVSNLTIALSYKMDMLNKIGNIQPQWGVGLAYTSNPAYVNNTTNMLIALNIGAKMFVTDNFALEGNLIPLAYNSFTAAGATTTTLSIFNAAGVVPSAMVGAHVYL